MKPPRDLRASAARPPVRDDGGDHRRWINEERSTIRAALPVERVESTVTAVLSGSQPLELHRGLPFMPDSRTDSEQSRHCVKEPPHAGRHRATTPLFH